MTTVTLPSGLKTIGNNAFANCKNLKEITFASGLETIGNSAFANCKMLEEATLSSGLKTIGERAFEECSSLKQITLSSGLESIGVNAFAGCSSLAKTNFNGTASQWAQVNFEYNNAKQEFESNPIFVSENLYLNGELALYIEIKNVKNISDYAFANCKTLRKVTIGDNVEKIGESAFLNCFRLIKVITSDSVSKICSDAFRNCYNLSSVTLGKNVKTLNETAFYRCYNLFEVYNLSSLSLFGTTFSNAKDIYESLDAPSKLSTDAKGYIIYINGTDKILVGYDGTDRTLTLPQGITEIGKYVFYDCYWIEHITIQDGLKTIGESAFEKCSNLKTIILPTSVTSIDYCAFYYSGLNAIYYKGTEEDWEKLEWSTNKVYYYSETKPTDTQNNYWHYDTDEKTPITTWES